MRHFSIKIHEHAQKQLDEAARLIIEEAQAVENDRIFSATGFASENISIVHQQMRCVNLAWGLMQTKRVKRGDVVAIVGGSFSGLMLSATLAIADDVIVYLFEKKERLLYRFQDKGHRYLSPNLNSRYLGKRFDPQGLVSFFEPPIFKWRSGIASDVAAQWLEEFKRYEQKLPIFTFLDRDRYDGRVISEICWWLDTWFRLEHWKSNGWSLRLGGTDATPVFRAIEEIIKPHLVAAFPRRNRHRISWDDREAFALRLPLKVQLEAREAVRAIADPWISRAMQRLVHSLPLSKLLRTRRLHAMARPGVTVTLNGTMPTPYSRALSTYNVWLMRVLLSFPNVRFRQGAISKVEANDGNGFSVTFDHGPMQVFDRVVTRYGAAPARSMPISTRRSRDPHTGSWLLTPVRYRRPGNQPETSTIVEPAVHRIASKLVALEQRRGSHRSEGLNDAYPVACQPFTRLDEPRSRNTTDRRAVARPTWPSRAASENTRDNSGSVRKAV